MHKSVFTSTLFSVFFSRQPKSSKFDDAIESNRLHKATYSKNKLAHRYYWELVENAPTSILFSPLRSKVRSNFSEKADLYKKNLNIYVSGSILWAKKMWKLFFVIFKTFPVSHLLDKMYCRVVCSFITSTL